jgi:hypothetical protein
LVADFFGLILKIAQANLLIIARSICLLEAHRQHEWSVDGGWNNWILTVLQGGVEQSLVF